MNKTIAISMMMLIVHSATLGLGHKQKGITVNRDLKNLCKSRISAFAEHDVQKLITICTDTYRLITPSGTQMNINDITGADSGKVKNLSSFTLYRFQSYMADDKSMAFAVAEVTEEVLAEKDSIPIVNNLLVTEVYVRHSGMWKIQLTHISQKMCFY